MSSDRRTIASGATVGPASGLTDCVKVNSSALAPETHEYLAGSSLVELDFAREREMYEDKGDAIVFSTNKSIRVPFHQDYDPNAMLCYVNAAANISDQYTRSESVVPEHAPRFVVSKEEDDSRKYVEKAHVQLWLRMHGRSFWR